MYLIEYINRCNIALSFHFEQTVHLWCMIVNGTFSSLKYISVSMYNFIG